MNIEDLVVNTPDGYDEKHEDTMPTSLMPMISQVRPSTNV